MGTEETFSSICFLSQESARLRVCLSHGFGRYGDMLTDGLSGEFLIYMRVWISSG
jgi:hypothetical protein